jgi:hypothetical protein
MYQFFHKASRIYYTQAMQSANARVHNQSCD